MFSKIDKKQAIELYKTKLAKYESEIHSLSHVQRRALFRMLMKEAIIELSMEQSSMELCSEVNGLEV